MHEGVAEIVLFILAIGGAIGMFSLGYLSGRYDERKEQEKNNQKEKKGWLL